MLPSRFPFINDMTAKALRAFTSKLKMISIRARRLSGATPRHLRSWLPPSKGFPVSASSKVNFQLGSPGVGECVLSFSCVDGSGHAVVWVSVEDADPVRPSSIHETAKFCLRIEAAAVDVFASVLFALLSESTTSAVLYGNEP